MDTTTFNSTDIINALEHIELLDFDKRLFIEELENMDNNGKIVIVNEESVGNSNEKAEEKPNAVRIFNTPIYISVAQIVENIKGDFFATVIRLISNISKEESIATAIAKVLLPHIAVSIHLITNTELCVYTIAVELYIRDNKKFYNKREFEPKFIGDPYCDNLELTCKYRHKEMCCISKGDILKTLNSLEGKYILERNEANEYRYMRW